MVKGMKVQCSACLNGSVLLHSLLWVMFAVFALRWSFPHSCHLILSFPTVSVFASFFPLWSNDLFIFFFIFRIVCQSVEEYVDLLRENLAHVQSISVDDLPELQRLHRKSSRKRPLNVCYYGLQAKEVQQVKRNRVSQRSRSEKPKRPRALRTRMKNELLESPVQVEQPLMELEEPLMELEEPIEEAEEEVRDCLKGCIIIFLINTRCFSRSIIFTFVYFLQEFFNIMAWKR